MKDWKVVYRTGYFTSYTTISTTIEEYLELPRCASGTPTNAAPAISPPATVVGATLTLRYNEPLNSNPNSTPATSDYPVTVDDSTRTVDEVSISGSTVTLTLNPAVVAGETVVVNYTPGSSPVQDSDGKSAARLTNYPVTNNTPTDPPIYVVGSGVVDSDTLTLAYDEDLDTGSEPAATAYTVTADGATHTVNDVDIGGMTVTLTLSAPVLAGQTVLLSYEPPLTNPLQDLHGEDAALLSRVNITNSTSVPPSLVSTNDSAVVDGDTLTLTYNEPLKETLQPATTAYTVTVDTVGREVAGVVVSGSTVTLTLASAVVGGETVLVSYDSSQATNPVQDTGGTAAADLTNQAVTNVTNNAPVFTTHLVHHRGERAARRHRGG